MIKIFLGITVVSVIALSIGACSSSTMQAVERSDVVRVCNDGTLVGFDPETKRYTVAKGRWTGIVARNVELSEICQGVK